MEKGNPKKPSENPPAYSDPMQSGSNFFIVSKMNGKVVDIYHGNKGDGVSLIMNPKKSFFNKNQLWRLDNLGYIRSVLSEVTMFAYYSGQPLKTSKAYENPMGQWRVVQDKIVNGENLYLEIRGDCDKDGAELWAVPKRNAISQSWSFHLKY